MSYTFNPFIGNLDNTGTPIDTNQFALSAHSSTHHTGGTDAIAPNEIGAMFQLNTSSINVGGTSINLEPQRNTSFSIQNTSNSTGQIVLPAPLAGDTIQFRYQLSTNDGPVEIVGLDPSFDPIVLTTLSTSNQGPITFRATSSAPQSWGILPVDAHTHPASQIIGLSTASQMPSGAFAPSNLYQNLSSNWNESYTFIQSNSAQFLPSNTGEFSIETDALPVDVLAFKDGILLKKVPAPTFTYLSIDNTTTQLTALNNSYGGIINLGNVGATFTGLNSNQNNFITVNNLDYLEGNINVSVVTLTAINFPSLKGMNGTSFGFGSMSKLERINLPELEFIGGYFTVGSFFGVGVPLLADAIFPKLKYVSGILTIGGYGSSTASVLSAVLLPELIQSLGINIGSSTSSGNAIIRPYPNLTTIDLTNLQSTNGISINNAVNLKQLTFPSLKVLRSDTSFFGCSSLTDVNFPELEYIGGYAGMDYTSVGNNTISLTGLFLPKLKTWFGRQSLGGGNIFGSTTGLSAFEFGTNTLELVNIPLNGTFICNQRLNQTSVDNLLKAFARLDGTNGTTLFTNPISLAGSNSAPSYTGGVTTTTAGTNFVRTGTTVIASVVGHGHTNGDIVTFTGNGQAALNGTYTITVNSPDEFQYTTTSSGNITGSGTVTMRRTTVATDGFRYFQTIALRGTTVTINFP